MRLILLLLLVATPVWAQPPAHDPSLYPRHCQVRRNGPDETRVTCTVEGETAELGYRHEPGGPVELTRGRSWRTLGLLKTWNGRKLGPQLVPEGDPLPPPDVASALETAPTTQPREPVYTEIDHLILWTKRAQDEQGGIAAIQALIVSAVARANETYEQTGLDVRARLRHMQRVFYIESKPSTDLTRLSQKGDGHLDEIHALRIACGCDVVTLIGGGWAAQGIAGLGYYAPLPYAAMAFNIVDRGYAAGYLSFAHESGHNEGLQHDPGNAGCGANCGGYNYGHLDAGANFRTVMSYGGLPRIPRLSTPQKTYNGKPLGIPDRRDNAKMLRINAERVANFYPKTESGPEPPLPPQPCTFTVTPPDLTFPTLGGTKTLTVVTTPTCGWSVASYVDWATATGGRQGSGTATVTAKPNTGVARTGQVRIATARPPVTQAGQ